MPRRGDGKLGELFAAIAASGQSEFTRHQWLRLLNTVADDKRERAYLSSALQQRGFTESVVRLTDKAKGRMGG